MKNVSGKTSLYELLFSIPGNIARPPNVTASGVIDDAFCAPMPGGGVADSEIL
jgi:hypothetical protein